MRADAKTVQDVLSSGNQYLVPFFQRYYSWKRKHWEKLWKDIEYLLGKEGADALHFLGPLVCTPFETAPSEVHQFQLIDGQQRLTTLTLLLAAIRDYAKSQGDEGFAEIVHEDHLVHKRQASNGHFRVLPRTGDREAYMEIIAGNPDKVERRSGVKKAYLYFLRQIQQWCGGRRKNDLNDLRLAVLTRLNLVLITISGENQYEIFESLNATGLPLDESDLIRNYIFMAIRQEEQEDFQKKHWRQFEALFDREALPPKIATIFYRNFLMRNGEYIEKTGTFVAFKNAYPADKLDPVAMVEELTRYAKFEIAFRLPEEFYDPAIAHEFRRIRMLEVTTAHPLMMNLLDRFERREITKSKLLKCLRDLQSLVLRRSICGESTRPYHKWFTEAIRKLGDNPVKGFRSLFWNRWPDDKTFRARLLEFPIYRRERYKARLILEELEISYGHKEPVDLADAAISIEHVLPQRIGPNPSGRAWKKMLGDDWEQVQERWLHTLGNLTLTGYNPDMSNKPFDRKKKELMNSHLEINKWFSRLKYWTGEKIEARGQELADEVCNLFPRPKGGQPYQPKGSAITGTEEGSPGQKFRKAYWTRLNETLLDQGSDFVRDEIDDRAWQEFSTGMKWAKLWAKAFPRHKELRVEVYFKYKSGRDLYDHLLDQREAIEKEFGSELFWEEDTALMTVSIEDVNVKDDSAWDDQHDWLIGQLEAFRDAVLSRARKIAFRWNKLEEDE